MILADFLLPGSGSGWPKWNGSKRIRIRIRIRIRNTGINDSVLHTTTYDKRSCRKKLVSKRSLRHDPNFDQLVSKIFPDRGVQCSIITWYSSQSPFFKVFIFVPKISLSFFSSPLDILPDIASPYPFDPVIFFPIAMIFPSPLYNLKFFPNRLDKLSPPTREGRLRTLSAWGLVVF